MRWSKFLLFNVLGAISWAVVMTLLGFFFGKSWNLLEQYIKGAGLGLAAVLAVAFIVYQILRRRKKNTVRPWRQTMPSNRDRKEKTMQLTGKWIDYDLSFIRRRYDQIAGFFVFFEWLFLLPPGIRGKAVTGSNSRRVIAFLK